MLNLSDEIQPYLDHKMPLLRIHRYDGTQCSCGNPACQWDSEKGGSAGKHPAEKNGVHGAEPRTNAKIFAGKNAGVACGRGFVILDIDPRNGGNESLARLLQTHGPLPKTWQVASGGGGTHYYFSVENEQRGGKRVDGVDLIGLGGYALTAGSVHPNQKQYEWEVHPSECEMAPLPEWVRDACCKPKIETPVKTNFDGSIYDEQDVADILKLLDPNMPNDEWVRVGMALKDGGYSVDVFNEWSKQGRTYQGRKDVEGRWRSFKSMDGGIGFGSLIHWGEEAGWAPREVKKWDFAVPKAPTPEPEPKPKTRKERELPDDIIGVEAQNLYDSVMHKDKGFALETILFCFKVCAQMRHRTSVKKGVLHKYSVLLTPSGGGKAEYTNAAKTILKKVSDLLLIGDCASGQALRIAMRKNPTRAMIRDEGVERLIAMLNEKDANAVRLHEDFLSMWGGSPLEEIVTKDPANSSPQIDDPHMSFLFGGPTSSFEGMLKSGAALSSKGLLSRMDIIFGNPTKPKSGEFSGSKTYEPRGEFIELLRKIAGLEHVKKNVNANQKTLIDTQELILTRWESDDVRFLFDDFASECYDQTHSYIHPSVWSRVAERSLRDATTLAIAYNHERPTVTRKHMEWARRDALWKIEPIKNKCEEFLGKSDETKARDKVVLALKKEGGRCSRKKIAKWWPQWSSLDERIRQAAVDGLQRDGIISVTVSGAIRNKGEQIFVLLSE